MLSKEMWEQVCFPLKECRSHEPPIRLDRQSRIVLYGAGYGGLMFLELLRRRGLEPERFWICPQKTGADNHGGSGLRPGPNCGGGCHGHRLPIGDRRDIDDVGRPDNDPYGK